MSIITQQMDNLAISPNVTQSQHKILVSSSPNDAAATTTIKRAEKKGWLFKYKHKLCFPGWKQCWVVLYRHPHPKLCIYTDRSELVLDNAAQFVIDISNVMIVNKPKYPLWAKTLKVHRAKYHTFQLVYKANFGEKTTSNSILIFAAQSHQEKERWINSIMDVLLPVPEKVPIESVKCYLPRESQLLLNVNIKKEPTAIPISPSCNALQEQLSSMFSMNGALPFSKKDISLLNKLHMDSFNLANVDKILHFSSNKSDFEEIIMPSDLLKQYKDLLMLTGKKDNIFEKEKMFSLLSKQFQCYALKVAQELMWKVVRLDPTVFKKSFKYGDCISARFLCDYSEASPSFVDNADAMLLREIEIQRDSLVKIFSLSDLSIDIFCVAEIKGFKIILTLTLPESENGVLMDNAEYLSSISQKLSINSSHGDVLASVKNYELEGKLFSHVKIAHSYHLNTQIHHLHQQHQQLQLKQSAASGASMTCPLFVGWSEDLIGESEAFMEKLDSISLLPSNCSSLPFGIEHMACMWEKGEMIHSKYFLLIEIFSFTLHQIISKYLRENLLERNSSNQDEKDIICFILNSLNDNNFICSIFLPRIVEYFGLCLTVDQVEDIDKRHIINSLFNKMGISIITNKDIKNFVSFLPTDISYSTGNTTNFDAILYSRFNHTDNGHDVRQKLSIRLYGKDCNKLVKDDFICELLLAMAEKDSLTNDQKLRLSTLSLFFCQPKNGLLVSKCLIALLKCSFLSPDSFSFGAGVVERIKKELNDYFGFYSLNCLRIYDALADTMHYFGKIDYSLALNEECIVLSSKLLGRKHMWTIRIQEKIGNNQMMLGNCDTALVSFFECLRFISETGQQNQHSSLSRLYLVISQCTFLKGDITSALSYNEKSIFHLSKTFTTKTLDGPLMEAYLFQARICESQYSSLTSLTSIVTPQTEYYLGQAQQSYEKVLDYFKENCGIFRVEIETILEKLCKISLLSLTPNQKEVLLMIIRKCCTNSNCKQVVDLNEKEQLQEQLLFHYPSLFIQEALERNDEMKIYIFYKISLLQ